ncbi:TPA: AAA family ATPase [Legionella pneumophila]|nr:AAA family ATPase [Legionella pneumophila]HAU1655485.1 AAA family ATPase [Legionella pneumophila]
MDISSRSNKRIVETVCASELKPEPISWLWNGWIAAGKMHILGGAPGTGKTTICMYFAAVISRGGHWPDGSLSIVGNVLVWSGEDDPRDTLIPRLILAGSDLSRIHFITGISEGKAKKSFDPATDMEPLKRKMEEIGNVSLLIIDPIVSAISGDSHKNSEVRRGLQPLVDLAATMHFALIGITHLTKGTAGRDPIERITGSLAFGALARIVLVAAKSQRVNEGGNCPRIFLRAKSNIGLDEGGFEYDLHQSTLADHGGLSTSSVIWGNAIQGTARELLVKAECTKKISALDDAKTFLNDLLADGPVLQKTIEKECKMANISWGTVRRARDALGIISKKDGLGAWYWQLRSEDAQNN